MSQLLHFLVTDRQGFDNGVNMDVEVVGEAVLRFSRDIFQGQRVGNRDALSWNVYGPEVVFLGLEKHVLEPGWYCASDFLAMLSSGLQLVCTIMS